MSLSRFLFKKEMRSQIFYFLPENLRRAGGGIVRGERAKLQKISQVSRKNPGQLGEE
jgi:hypothetical protein